MCNTLRKRRGAGPLKAVPLLRVQKSSVIVIGRRRGHPEVVPIEGLRGEVDAGEDIVEELLDLTISDKSRAARQRLREAEDELDKLKKTLRETMEHRDALTSTNVLKRLAAVETALRAEPMNTEEANKALRGAVRKMIMRPQEGTLDILWHHAEEPQETVFITSRFDWDADQFEKNTEEAGQ